MKEQFLIQIISIRQKNADAKLLQWISHRQNGICVGNFQKIVFPDIQFKGVLNR